MSSLATISSGSMVYLPVMKALGAVPNLETRSHLQAIIARDGVSMRESHWASAGCFAHPKSFMGPLYSIGQKETATLARRRSGPGLEKRTQHVSFGSSSNAADFTAKQFVVGLRHPAHFRCREKCIPEDIEGLTVRMKIGIEKGRDVQTGRNS